MPNIHFLLESDTNERLHPCTVGDYCVDLTIKQDVGMQFVDNNSGVELIDCDWHEKEHLRAAIRAFSEWYAALGRTNLEGGECLIDVCRTDSHLSLWWMTELSNKDLFESTLFRVILFSHFLQRYGSGLKNIVYTCDDIHVWVSKEPERKRLTTHLMTLFGQTNTSSPVDTSLMANHLIYTVGECARIAEWASISLVRQQLVKNTKTPWAEAIADSPYVAVCTYDHEWKQTTDGEWTNRYWGDSIDRLRRLFSHVISVPTWVEPTTLPSIHRSRTIARDSPIGIGLPVAPGSTQQAFQTVRRIRSLLPGTFERLHATGDTKFCGLDLCQDIKADLEEFVSRRGLMHLQKYFSLRAFFEEHPPAVALYRNEFLSHGRWIRAAMPDQTLAIGLQHGLMLPDHSVQSFDKSWFPVELNDNELEPGARSEFVPMPSRFVSYSEPVKQSMSEWDYPMHRVLAFGSLRHDQMFDEARRQQPSQDQSKSPQEPLRLLISGGIKSQSRRFIRLALEASEEAGEQIQLFFKPHPRFPMTAFSKEMTAQYSRFYVLPHLDPMQHWFSSVDAMLVETSTTGLEALIFGVPLISVLKKDRTELYPFVEEGVAIGIRTPADLRRALERCASPSYRNDWEHRRLEFLKQHLSPTLGSATSVLSNEIRKFLHL